MNTFFKAALVSAVLAGAAVPALAQAQDFNHGQTAQRGFDRDNGYRQPAPGFVREGFDLFRQIDSLQNWIERGRMNGSIDRREARRVTDQLNDIRNDLTRATSGRNARLTPVMHDRFEQRLDRLGGMIRRASDDDNRRPYFRG